MTTPTLHPIPLTAEAFAPYGDVISTENGDSFDINGVTCQRFDSLAKIDADNAGGTAAISIFRAVPWPEPVTISMLERHPLGSQAFYPLHRKPWLIVVAKTENPGPDTLKVFAAHGDQGIQFHKGTWHHPLIVLDGGQDFLVVDRVGPGDNCDEIYFDDRPVAISLAAKGA